MFWENFKKLCELKNETPNSVCKALGFSNATSTHWKYGASPKGKTLTKIADYFGVSVDSLLGDGSESCYPSISKYRISIGNTPRYTVFCIFIRLDIIRMHKLSHYCALMEHICNACFKYET